MTKFIKMSRPDYPHCPLTSSAIGRIREEQERYDRDPGRYEYEQQRQREISDEEEMELRQQERQEYEKEMMRQTESYEEYCRLTDQDPPDENEIPF